MSSILAAFSYSLLSRTRCSQNNSMMFFAMITMKHRVKNLVIPRYSITAVEYEYRCAEYKCEYDEILWLRDSIPHQ